MTAEQTKILSNLKEQVSALNGTAREQQRMINVIRIRAADDIMTEVCAFAANRQYSMVDTLRRLAEDRLSFARFGDGELRLMDEPGYNLGFQRNSPLVRQALKDVLTQQDRPDLLVGLPQIWREVNGTTLWSSVWSNVRHLFPGGVMYGNSHVSRRFFFSYIGEEGVRLWRKVWDGRQVCVITGERSRFDLIPELFGNVAGSRFLYSTPRHAMEQVDHLVNEAMRLPDDVLFLVSLGPAGTVLAARLATAGRQAIDIGHISDSYLHVFTGAPIPEHKPAAREKVN
jgi:hypothetical protein